MTPGERFKSWIDGLAEAWKDRLRGWMLRWVAEGIAKLFENLEDESLPSAHDFVDTFPLHPEVKKTLQAFMAKRNPVHIPAFAAMAIGVVVGSLIGTFMGWAAPIARWTSYVGEKVIKSHRLDPGSIITAWRRDKPKYQHLFDDLRDQGWDDDRIETLKFATLFYPNPADLVRWQAREVFEPEMIARYGLDDEFGGIDKQPFYKAGMTDEQIRNYWRAHWEHASWMQVVEMLHRGQLTEQEVWDWFRVVEIPPFWRDKLIAISWNVPTRVDVRRWRDMGTISVEELRKVYERQGYHGKDLDDFVLWTEVYNAFPDLIARWSKGWITIDVVRSELIGLGMPADRVEELIETKMKAAQPERTLKERDLTKSEIVKGVKKGVITRVQGVDLLTDMGFDEGEAAYILDINIPVDQEEAVVKKRELTKADILKGLKLQIITEEVATAKLVELRYTPEDATFIMGIYKAAITPPEAARDREASKADIVLAVKKGLITSENGYLMLQDIGFTPEASQFILEVRAEVSPFSPISYSEFKGLTEEWRRSAGMKPTGMPVELKAAADEVVRLTKEVESLQESVKAEEATLIAEEPLPEAAAAKLKKLRVSLRRGEASLAKAKSDYDRLLAQWRHTG